MDPNIAGTPGFAIGRARHLMQTELKNRLTKLGLNLSPEGATVLLLVAGVSEPIRVSDLARLAIRDSTTLKRQIDSLVKLVYVVQEKDRSDGRVVLVSMTALGKEAVVKIVPMLEELQAKALDGFSEVEHNQLVDLLQRIQRNLLDR